MTAPWHLPSADLDRGVDAALADLEALRGARVLVTGGTGSLGCWVVSSLLRADERLGLGLRIEMLTRNPAAVPLDESRTLRLVRGDVRGNVGVDGQVDVIVHAAAASYVDLAAGAADPREMVATVVDGTKAVLEVATRSRARLLFLSSGAVYGPQRAPVAEDDQGAPDSMSVAGAYGQAKRLAETLCAVATAACEVDAVVARLFAFVGPRIATARGAAAGSFLSSAVAGEAVDVDGDGRPMRSYLYSGDLPEWCWALVTRGAAGRAYNVGSDEAISVADLANRIARLPGAAVPVRIGMPPSIEPPGWYVPSIGRSRTELGLGPRTPLEDSLRATFAWLGARR